MIAKCPCDECGENIEFATEEFLPGSSVTCPHCGSETFLSVSPKTKSSASLPPKLSPLPVTPPVAPPQMQKSSGVSRTRVKIFLAIFFGLTVFFSVFSAMMTIPTDEENADTQKIIELQKKYQVLDAEKNRLEKLWQNGGSEYFAAYEKASSDWSDNSFAQDKLVVDRKFRENDRNASVVSQKRLYEHREPVPFSKDGET
jgi:DNA-directed RNA polymerase subunit RPC12/RpoP